MPDREQTPFTLWSPDLEPGPKCGDAAPPVSGGSLLLRLLPIPLVAFALLAWAIASVTSLPWVIVFCVIVTLLTIVSCLVWALHVATLLPR